LPDPCRGLRGRRQGESVTKLAAQGLTTRQIAGALFVTPQDGGIHLRHTYEKLDISSRTQFATALAATNSDAEDHAMR
jgi:DNA-binding CsgD family transcriptional regulator